MFGENYTEHFFAFKVQAISAKLQSSLKIEQHRCYYVMCFNE